MEINYNIENDLDWNNAEVIEIKPEGWKKVKIKFIDANPVVFWRINEIEHNFTSNSNNVAKNGIEESFSYTLKILKMIIVSATDKIPEKRKKFYEENIVELFDE